MMLAQYLVALKAGSGKTGFATFHTLNAAEVLPVAVRFLQLPVVIQP